MYYISICTMKYIYAILISEGGKNLMALYQNGLAMRVKKYLVIYKIYVLNIVVAKYPLNAKCSYKQYLGHGHTSISCVRSWVLSTEEFVISSRFESHHHDIDLASVRCKCNICIIFRYLKTCILQWQDVIIFFTTVLWNSHKHFHKHISQARVIF